MCEAAHIIRWALKLLQDLIIIDLLLATLFFVALFVGTLPYSANPWWEGGWSSGESRSRTHAIMVSVHTVDLVVINDTGSAAEMIISNHSWPQCSYGVEVPGET